MRLILISFILILCLAVFSITFTTSLEIPTTWLTPSEDCVATFSQRYFSVSLRFATAFGSKLKDLEALTDAPPTEKYQERIDAVVAQILSKSNLHVRIKVQDLLGCGGTPSKPADVSGIIILYCNPSGDKNYFSTVKTNPITEAGLCGPSNGSFIVKYPLNKGFFNSTPSQIALASQIDEISNHIIDSLVKSYELDNEQCKDVASAVDLFSACIPSLSKKFCGDGIIQVGEECEVNSMYLAAKTLGFYSGAFNACSNCSINTVYEPGYIDNDTFYTLAQVNEPSTQMTICDSNCGPYTKSLATPGCKIAGALSEATSPCWEWIKRPFSPISFDCVGRQCFSQINWFFFTYIPSGKFSIASGVDSQSSQAESKWSSTFYSISDSNQYTPIPVTDYVTQGSSVKCTDFSSLYYSVRVVRCAALRSSASGDIVLFDDFQCAGQKPSSQRIPPTLLQRCTYISYYDHPDVLDATNPTQPLASAPQFISTRRGPLDNGQLKTLQLPKSFSLNTCTAAYMRDYACIRITSTQRIFVSLSSCALNKPLPEMIPSPPSMGLSRQTIWENRCTYQFVCTTTNPVTTSQKSYKCTQELDLCQNNSCFDKIDFVAKCSAFVDSEIDFVPALPRLDHTFCTSSTPLSPSYIVNSSTSMETSGILQCTSLLATSGCFSPRCIVGGVISECSTIRNAISTSTQGDTPFGLLTDLCTFVDNTLHCGDGVMKPALQCSRVVPNSSPVSYVPVLASGCPSAPATSSNEPCYYQCPSTVDTKCTFSLADSQPNGLNKVQMAAILQDQFGFDEITQVPTRGLCVTTPSLPLYCGTINWVRTRVCFSKGTEDPADCETITPPETLSDVAYSNCRTRCHDAQSFQPDNSMKFLFECKSNQSSQVILSGNVFASSSCGLASDNTDNSLCKSHIQTIVPLCQYFDQIGELHNALDQSLCQVAPKIKALFPNGQTTLLSTPTILKIPCWKASNTMSLNNFNLASFSGQAISATFGSKCHFAQQCKFSYQDYMGSPNQLILPSVLVPDEANPVPLTQYKTQFCDSSFEFPCVDVCGTVDQTSRCVVQKPDLSYSDVFDLFPSSSDNPDDFVVSNRKSLVELCFGSQINPINAVVTSNVCTNTSFSDCYEVQCSLPRDFSQPVTSLAEFSAELCQSRNWDNFCRDSLVQGFCGDKVLNLTKRCLDKRAQVILAVNSIDETTCLQNGSSGMMSAKCSNYSECEFVSQECTWQVDETGLLLQDTGYAQGLCTRAFNTDLSTFCSDENLCGPSTLATSCTVIDKTSSSSLSLTSSICVDVFGPDGSSSKKNQFKPIPNGSIKCADNYHRCSSWVCGPTSTSKLTLSQLSNLPTSSFDPLLGSMNAQQCTRSLAQSQCSNLCGAGSVSRSVGCLRQITSDYTATPKTTFFPSAVKCGNPILTIGAQSAPISSLPCTGQNCQYNQQCSFLNSPFDSSKCTTSTLGCLPTPPIQVSLPAQDLQNRDIVLPISNADIIPVLDSTYVYEFNTFCFAQNGTRVNLNFCDKSLSLDGFSGSILTSATCPYQPQGSFCLDNIKTTIDFTINSKVTGNSTIDGPLSLRTRYGDSQCTKVVTLSSPTVLKLEQNGLFALDNTIVTSGISSIRITFGYSGPVGTLISVYLLPLDHIESNTSKIQVDSPTGSREINFSYFTTNYFYEEMPYLAATLSSTTPTQTMIIPSFIPSGTYAILLYIDKLTFSLISSVNMTVVNPAASHSFSSFTTLLDTVSRKSCIDIACFNGLCDDQSDSLNDAVCLCHAGYSGPSCLNSVMCSVALSDPLKPVCDLSRGFASTEFESTQYTSKKSTTPPVISCDRCTCNGLWNPLDGCKTCLLQCGLKSTADENCVSCLCASGWVGGQCQCYITQFTLHYNRAPGVLAYIYSEGLSLDQLGPIENAQIDTWKTMLLNDISFDLRISLDNLSVENFGSLDQIFVVIIGVKFCAPYENQPISSQSSFISENHSSETSFHISSDDSAPTTPEEINAWAAKFHFDNIQVQIEEFNHSLFVYRSILKYSAPQTYIELPTFNYTTLRARDGKVQNLNVILPSHTAEISDDEEDSALIELYAQLINSPSKYNSLNPATYLFIPLSTIASSSLGSLVYKQSQLATSPFSDASGGLVGLGNAYDSYACDDPASKNCSQPPSLSQSVPDRPQPAEKKEVPVSIIVGVILGFIFLTLFIISVLCCFSWVRQIWCFQDYRKRKKEQQEEKKRQGKKSRTPVGTNLTVPSGATRSIELGTQATSSSPSTTDCKQPSTTHQSNSNQTNNTTHNSKNSTVSSTIFHNNSTENSDQTSNIQQGNTSQTAHLENKIQPPLERKRMQDSTQSRTIANPSLETIKAGETNDTYHVETTPISPTVVQSGSLRERQSQKNNQRSQSRSNTNTRRALPSNSQQSDPKPIPHTKNTAVKNETPYNAGW